MPPQNPWTSPTSKGSDSAGLVSIGSLEVKVPSALYPLLLSFDVPLNLCKNYGYPQDLSSKLINEIQGSLQKKDVNNVVFDLRIHNWTNTPHFKRSRIQSRTLLNVCHDLEINTSIILSNGSQLLGNAVGSLSETMEVSDILKGEGPPDLTKFIIEIGADFLMMTKKADQRPEAKKLLRDKLLAGGLSPSSADSSERWKVLAWREGYVDHLAMDEIHTLKLELANEHPGISLSLKKKTSDWVEIGDEVIEFFLPKGHKNPIDREICRKVFVFSTHPPKHQPLLLERLGLNRDS